MKQLAQITVIGRDKTGVIARIAGFLFLQKANIEALEEQVTRGQFSMTLQTSWTDGELNREKVVHGLRLLAQQLKMEITVRFYKPRQRQRMAILVTKEPHCLETILGNLHALRNAEPAVVLSNRRDLEPMARAGGVGFVRVPWENRSRAEERTLQILAENSIDFVVLARFMKILSPNFVWRYKNKIPPFLNS